MNELQYVILNESRHYFRFAAQSMALVFGMNSSQKEIFIRNYFNEEQINQLKIKWVIFIRIIISDNNNNVEHLKSSVSKD